MIKFKCIACLAYLALFLIAITLQAAATEYVYSEWSVWQTDPVTASDTVEVETRTVDVTETKTQYTYEFWRYWNKSAGRYMYKGNGNWGGDHYSVTLDYKLKYYKDTSDGPDYIVGNSQYIYFKGECWFNQKEISTPVVTGQRTEYKYRTKTAAPAQEQLQEQPQQQPQEQPHQQPAIKQNPISATAPEPPQISLNKQKYFTGEPIIIIWLQAQDVISYTMHIQGVNNYLDGYTTDITGLSWSFTVNAPGKYKVWGESVGKISCSPRSDDIVLTVSDILIDPQNLTITQEDTAQLSAKFADGYTGVKKIIWSSNDTKVATVDSNGLVTAKSEGTAEISVSIDGKIADTSPVVVNPFETADLPMKYLNISQGVNGSFSHRGTNQLDLAGADKGIDDVFAPFTGVIKKIYTKTSNTIWLESCKKVRFADGTVDYMTVMLSHDNDVSDLYVGQVIPKGQVFYQEGRAGYSTGNHIQIECGRGKFVKTGWYENKSGSWMIYNSILPYKALFITNNTIIKKDYGYPWELDPTN